MSRLAWYLKRIRVMTPREVGYRIGQLLTFLSMRFEFGLGIGGGRASFSGGQEAFQFCQGGANFLPSLRFDMTRLKQAMPDLIAGRIYVAGQIWQWCDAPDIWLRAPDTGRRWPSSFFGAIAFRQGNPYGDVRQLWEPSRLQHLLNLALLAHSSKPHEQEQILRIVNAQLSSWIHQNPALSGPHYISAMECSLRLIAACHTLDVLRDYLHGSPAWDALTLIAATHVPFIERRLSLHSSEGNHTVAEAAGLIYAGLLFSEMKGSRQRLQKGISLFSASLSAQVLPDGGGVEQALWYHYFNMQLGWMIHELLRHHDQPVPSGISAALARGMHFLSAMGYSSRWIPHIGDGDSGCALSCYLEVPLPSTDSVPATQVFHDSGYTAARIGREPAARLIMDHGPLGMPPGYGHGHADALSVLLRVDETDVLVDPGTYSYTGDWNWRQYFRATRAHNTIVVGAADQAQQEGPFLWSNPYTARLIDSDIEGSLAGRVVADHDGYRGLGIRHVRGIAWVENQWVAIHDCVLGESIHMLQLHWHLPAEIACLDSNCLSISLPRSKLMMRLRGGDISCHRGLQQPIVGWRSRAYGELEPITTLRVQWRGLLPHRFTTLISLQGDSLPPDTAYEGAVQWIEDRL